jgi:tetratricopeptide (TPR) repeat protein
MSTLHRTIAMLAALAFTAASLALAAPGAAPSHAQGDTPAQKVIKDPAEYSAYINALNLVDPSAKAAAMEAFIAQYPDSVMKIDALQQVMQAYQAAGEPQKLQETANRILQIDPNDLRALAIVTFIERGNAKSPEQAAKTRRDGEKGLAGLASWHKLPGDSDADNTKLKEQMAVIFAGAAGFGALEAKDYATARGSYLRSVKIDSTNLQDVYQLGLACLEMNPLDKNGFWYVAKAINLARGNDAAVNQMAHYAKAKYNKYHGNDDGWDQIVSAAANETAPGPEIAAIKPAVSPQELACNALAGHNSLADLSMADVEFILRYRDSSDCNREAADKVWTWLLNRQRDANGDEVKIRLQGAKVIAASSDSVDVALTEENQQANQADLHVVLGTTLAHAPAHGSSIDITGVLTTYRAQPFLLTMEKAEFVASGAQSLRNRSHPRVRK